MYFGNVIRSNTPSINTSVAPDFYPRNDLVVLFLQGVPGVTAQQLVGERQCGNLTVMHADMLRLSTIIAPVSREAQNPLGVIGLDNAGYPNGASEEVRL